MGAESFISNLLLRAAAATPPYACARTECVRRSCRPACRMLPREEGGGTGHAFGRGYETDLAMASPGAIAIAFRRRFALSRAHDLDQRYPPRLSRLFRQRRARDRAFGLAGAAQRPDADVYQCRDG